MQAITLNDSDAASLIAFADQARVDGTKITQEDVIAIWQNVSAIPGFSSAMVWVELGRQSAEEQVTSQGVVAEVLGKKANGYIHILAKHGDEFANNEIHDVFGHFDNCLAAGEQFHYKNKEVIYAVLYRGRIVTTCIRTSSSGYMTTAHPYNRPAIEDHFARILGQAPVDDNDEEEAREGEQRLCVVPYYTFCLNEGQDYVEPEEYCNDQAVVDAFDELRDLYEEVTLSTVPDPSAEVLLM